MQEGRMGDNEEVPLNLNTILFNLGEIKKKVKDLYDDLQTNEYFLEEMVHLNVNENQEVSSAKNEGFNNTVSFDSQYTYPPVKDKDVLFL